MIFTPLQSNIAMEDPQATWKFKGNRHLVMEMSMNNDRIFLLHIYLSSGYEGAKEPFTIKLY